MASNKQEWRGYESVAEYLLDRIADELGLPRVEEKQCLAGASGTEWEVDAKGVPSGDGGVVVIECKRYPKDKISQAIVGSLAYVIGDVGGSGGILVSPLGLQEGAKKVAEAENIVEVHLTADSTTTEYILDFLNRAFVGVQDTITAVDDAVVIVVKNSDDQPK